MSQSRTTIAILTAVLLVLTTVGVPAGAVSDTTVLGQTASVGARVDGIVVPSGTTLLSPVTIETGAQGGVVHLANGQVLALSRDAAARLAQVAEGDIEIHMESGSLAYAEIDGTVTTVAAHRRVVLGPQGATASSATPAAAAGSEQEERLCQLQDSTPQRFALCSDPETADEEECDWEYLEVPMSEVSQYLDVDSVLACEDRNVLDLNCDCDTDVAALGWWVVGGLAGATAVGIVLVDNEDEQVASPTTP